MIKIDQLDRKAITLHLQEKIGAAHDQRIKVGLESGSRGGRRKRVIRRGNRRSGGNRGTRETNLAKILASNTSRSVFEVGDARRVEHPTIETAVTSLSTIFPKLVLNSLLCLGSRDRGAGSIEKGRKKRANPGGRKGIVSLTPRRTTTSSTTVRSSGHGRVREKVQGGN